MALVPDLPWSADRPAVGPGVVLVTELHLRRLADVPAFLRASLAIRRQVAGSRGARALLLRARPLTRTFTTVSWWDDDAAVRAFARTDPHRGAMRYWAPRLTAFSNRTLPGDGTPPTVDGALAAAAAAPSA